ncbi:hypothetical protein JTB14_006176 [Gonioctena quinquepunctata]|nr:hypothetical protein JTB14_006176 [Gonioctena quinquepunctata]
MSEEKRLLRSNKLKVKLTEIPEEFKPRHRSTDIPSPFEGRSRHPEQEQEDEVFLEADQERPPEKIKPTQEKILGESCKEKMANTTIEETLQRTPPTSNTKIHPTSNIQPWNRQRKCIPENLRRRLLQMVGTTLKISTLELSRRSSKHMVQ